MQTVQEGGVEWRVLRSSEVFEIMVVGAESSPLSNHREVIQRRF